MSQPEITLERTRTVRHYTVTGADPVTVAMSAPRTVAPATMEITLRNGLVVYVDLFGPRIRRDGTPGERTRVGWAWTDPRTSVPAWVADVLTRDGLTWQEADHV
jgi:hypothetical protein